MLCENKYWFIIWKEKYERKNNQCLYEGNNCEHSRSVDLFSNHCTGALLFSSTTMSLTPWTCVSCSQCSEANNFLAPQRVGTNCSVRVTEAWLPISLRIGQEMTAAITKEEARQVLIFFCISFLLTRDLSFEQAEGPVLPR